MNKSIKKAIELCGSQSEFAARCRVKQSSVNKWLHGYGINGCHISAIVKATGGAITHAEICDELSSLMAQRRISEEKYNGTQSINKKCKSDCGFDLSKIRHCDA